MPPATLEITGVYLGEKPRTRKPGSLWAVHQIRVLDNGGDERFVVGQVHEVSGESEPAGWNDEENEYVAAELQCNTEYRFYGKYEENVYRGLSSHTLAFSTFNKCEPLTEKAVVTYLQNDIPHIGPRVAQMLWNAFGSDAVRTLREMPEVAVEACKRKLHIDHARAAAERLAGKRAIETVTMETMGLLDGYGMPKATAKAAIKKFGNLAAKIIKLNPYHLMKFRGVGFLKADKVYQTLGLPLGRFKRQTLAVWYALKSDPNGHTWHKLSFALTAIRKTVGGVPTIDAERLAKIVKKYGSVERYAIAIGVRAKLLATYVDDDGETWVAEGVKARAEERLAGMVLAAMEEPNPWQAVLDSPLLPQAIAPLSDHQREKLLDTLRGGTIAILTGGPGSGKTFSAAALMRLLVELFGEHSIAATAFTGKASQRFTQGMRAYNLPVVAKTTHALLGTKTFGDDDDGEEAGAQFEHNAANPLPARTIDVDEVSMDDTPLLCSIFAARSRGTGVFLVGDERQLPPIGHGAPLRDLKRAGIPFAELTEIRRNAGTVVRACKKLRERERITAADFVPFDELDPDADDPKNLSLLHATTPQACIDQMLFAIRSIRDRFGYDAVWQTQVIVARNEKGELSRVELNEILEREFNPQANVLHGCRFRVGSKGMQLKNLKYQTAEWNGEKYEKQEEQSKAFNGEFCKVVDVDDSRVIAQFFMPDRLLWIPRRRGDDATELSREKKIEASTNDDGGNDSSSLQNSLAFDLGNAATCHKMQGSQEKHIVLVLDRGAYNLSLEWLLTGWSRMEKVCTTIGDLGTIQRIAARSSLDDRKTFLAERIREGRLFASRAWWIKEQNEINQTELVTT